MKTREPHEGVERPSRFRPSEIPGVGRINSRVDRAVRWRIEEALGPILERLDAQERRLHQLERRLNERLPEAVRRSAMAISEVRRIQPQTASVEQRLEELRERFDTNLDPGTQEDQVEARRLVDEIRTEHARIRSRMTAIGWYEDRLRKLEEGCGGA